MSENEVLGQEPQFAALVGIDWADQKHALQAAGTTQRESGEVEHTPEAVEAWVGQLCQRFGNWPIAVAVEQVKGALVFMLSKLRYSHPTNSRIRAALFQQPRLSATIDPWSPLVMRWSPLPETHALTISRIAR